MLKDKVKKFWDRKPCGEIYASGQTMREYYASQGKARYELEPYVVDFAKFEEARGKDILEIGVGMGADHLEWARAHPKSLAGIDLSPNAIEHTKKHLSLYNLNSDIKVADAEELPFSDNSFDIVYSWGVLHHTPDTPRAVSEAVRVLRPGGVARIMIYHKYSLTGYMLWLRYGFLAGHPFRSLDYIFGHYLESPGTKAYTIQEAQQMFAGFSKIDIKMQLSFGDLLQGAVGQRHGGFLLFLSKALWPRGFLKKFFRNHGSMLLIEARK